MAETMKPALAEIDALLGAGGLRLRCKRAALAGTAIVEEFQGSFSAEHGIGPYNQAIYERFTAPEQLKLAGALQALTNPNALLGIVHLAQGEPRKTHAIAASTMKAARLTHGVGLRATSARGNFPALPPIAFRTTKTADS